MSFDESLIREISILTLLSKEGKIDDDQFDRLESLLQTDKLARQYYVMLVNNDLFLKDSDVLRCLDTQREFDFLLELAEYEKTAPSIEMPREKPKRELIQKVTYPKFNRSKKLSKWGIGYLITTAAAVIFMVLFAKFAPPKGGIEVATLTDSMDAKWADIAVPMEKGTRIATGYEWMLLREGYAELLFDNLTRVTVEAPAEFRILAEDRIGLKYGKVYSAVSKKAIGFSVYTQNAKIIDLGTEFGVQVALDGDTQLDVLKGKTMLVSGEADKVNMEVCGGTAKKISGVTGEISDTVYRPDLFVRNINSEANIAWRGQKALDLADMVRNGNGLGTGNSQVHLSYAKGITKDYCPGYTLTLKNYRPIKDHPFIDGIFIPNGKTVISSRGDVFENFLWTDGVYSADLLAGPEPGYFNIDGQSRVIQFGGQEYSDRGKSCIVMHNSNHGITFDLDAIRGYYNLKIDRFKSQVGLADLEDKRCNANFYVLVDGQLRFSLLGYTQKGVLNDVSIELKDTDRFLTLATSENVDQIDYMANSTLYNNYCVFTEPVLVLE